MSTHHNLPAYPIGRLRRLRQNSSIRSLCAETTLSVNDLIQPIFIIEGSNQAQPIATFPDIYRYSIDLACKEVKHLYQLGIKAIAIFPQIDNPYKTALAEQAHNPDGLVPRAINAIKQAVPEILIISDIALDPYTEHGQDGLIDEEGEVLNDETIDVLIKQSLTYARVGCDVIAPSDMMDGRIGMIRQALEKQNFTNTLILAYSAKYASNFYSPFRDAVGSGSTLQGKSKSTYQMDFRNTDEAITELQMDISEGADIVMVKPALHYLDIIQRASEQFRLPVFCYHTSGEYAMLKNAIAQNLAPPAAIEETLFAFKRAGATAIFTYLAKEYAEKQ